MSSILALISNTLTTMHVSQSWSATNLEPVHVQYGTFKLKVDQPEERIPSPSAKQRTDTVNWSSLYSNKHREIFLTLDTCIHRSSVLRALPESSVLRANDTPSARFLTCPLTSKAAAAFSACEWFNIVCENLHWERKSLSIEKSSIVSFIRLCIHTYTKLHQLEQHIRRFRYSRLRLTNASAIGPFSPESTRLSISALYSGPPPLRLSRAQRGMPKSTRETILSD